MRLNALMNSYWSASASLLPALSIGDTYAPLQAYPCSNFLNENGNWKEHFLQKKKRENDTQVLLFMPPLLLLPLFIIHNQKEELAFQSDLAKKGLSL